MIRLATRSMASLALLLAATVGLSATAAAQSDISADKRAGIEQLIELMNLDQLTEQTLTAMEQQMVGAIRQRNPDIEDGALEIVVDTFNEQGRAFMEASFQDIPPIMAKYYTADEIDQIVDFYETPVGQKALQVMPQMMQDIQLAMAPRLQQFQQTVVTRIQERLRDAGY